LIYSKGLLKVFHAKTFGTLTAVTIFAKKSTMVKSLLIQNCSFEDVKHLLEDFQQLLEEINSKLSISYKLEYLTRKETAELLKCDISTVHHWTTKGKLKAYYMGNRVYYKSNEIEAGMITLDEEKFQGKSNLKRTGRKAI